MDRTRQNESARYRDEDPGQSCRPGLLGLGGQDLIGTRGVSIAHRRPVSLRIANPGPPRYDTSSVTNHRIGVNRRSSGRPKSKAADSRVTGAAQHGSDRREHRVLDGLCGGPGVQQRGKDDGVQTEGPYRVGLVAVGGVEDIALT